MSKNNNKTSSPSDFGNQEKKTKGRATAMDEHVGQRLRMRRNIMGLSQEKLAELLGITFQQIQKYERGSNRISAGRLHELSKILEIQIGWFFEQFDAKNEIKYERIPGFGEDRQDEIIDDKIFQEKETLELVKIYYSIESTKLRKDAVKFLKSIAESSKE